MYLTSTICILHFTLCMEVPVSIAVRHMKSKMCKGEMRLSELSNKGCSSSTNILKALRDNNLPSALQVKEGKGRGHGRGHG